MASPVPVSTVPAMLGDAMQMGSGMSSAQYSTNNVSRNGTYYVFMSNGWGPGFESQTVTWNGTAFTVTEMQGTQGENYEPATYPTVFCGKYSNKTSQKCGLPASIDSITSLRTGWRWNPNGNTGEYNAAYDIWVGPSATQFGGYLMVWLRDPPGQQPAGSPEYTGVTVQNVEGVWDIWTGTVNNAPIVNWVRSEGSDTTELEFDVKDFLADAAMRGIEVPGTYIHSVAVGFEIWNGPITNLASEDFYVEVK
jgi:Glycosyl hydrolase family 12